MNLVRIVILVLLALGLLRAPALAAPAQPLDQLRSTVDSVLEILRDKSLEKGLRRQKLNSVVRARFDFNSMSQRILATHWQSASAQERSRFVELFSDLLEANYIGRIEAYTDETVKYLGEQVVGERAQINTLIVTKSVEIPINYRLQQRGDQWLAYDVIIESVSFISNYRATYGEIINREGMGGLLQRMEEKLRELRSAEQAGKQT